MMVTIRHMLVIGLLVAAIAGLQFWFDGQRLDSSQESQLVLPAPVLRLVDLGLNSAASSLVWLTAIQNFEPNSQKRSRNTVDYIKIVNDLDPKFSYPYAFAVLTLPVFGRVDEAVAIGERGLEAAEPNFRIPYYMAVIYHVYKNDRANAAKYFNIAAFTPGAPNNVKSMAASYGITRDRRQQTRLIWEDIYENSRDNTVRDQALAQLERLTVFDILEKAAQDYKGKFGRYPNNVAELFNAGFLRKLPEDSHGLTYTIDDTGRAGVQ